MVWRNGSRTSQYLTQRRKAAKKLFDAIYRINKIDIYHRGTEDTENGSAGGGWRRRVGFAWAYSRNGRMFLRQAQPFSHG
ncbi:MAG: hypothetical protein GX455_05460 [Phycisphaerae bacterium]|nr:hypothetical protein [Phycisphaerae bacterium]